jgi:hypothetical protein
MWHVWRRKEMHTHFGRENEGNRPFGRPRCRQEDHINMSLKEKEWKWEIINWINLAQEMDNLRALLNEVMNFQVL